MKRQLASALICLIACAWAASAQAQSSCKYIAFGAVLTPGQWQFCFEQKQDVLGYTPVNKAGDTMTGRLVTAASTTSMAGFNLPQGAGPSAPVNGDLWTTSAGMFVRISGVTIELTGGSSAFFAGTSPITVSFPGGVVTYAFNLAVANNFTGTQTFSNGTYSALFSGGPIGAGTTAPVGTMQLTHYAGADAPGGSLVLDRNATAGGPGNYRGGSIFSYYYSANPAGHQETLSFAMTTTNTPIDVTKVKMVIDESGFVGLLNTNPTARLDVNGDIQLPTGNSYFLGPNGGTYTGRLYSDNSQVILSGGNTTNYIRFDPTWGIERMRITLGVTVGAPTGSDEGAGTINAAGAYYLNGTKIAQTATSPLVITNGVIACSTCLTSTPAAMTQSNDTNVTLTLGGTPATSLLQAVSLTMGWTGTLAAARLNSAVVQGITNDTNVTGSISAQVLTLGWAGTLAAGRLNANVVQAITNDTNVTGSISAQNLTLGWTGTLAAGRLNSNVVQSVVNDTNVTGSISAQALTLGWTGTLANARLATMATNTIKGNATSGTASPTDLAIGSCSTAASALIWTTNTGFGCNTSITAAAVPASGLTGTTLASGVVTSSLTTVGTIGTGVWQGTKIGLAYGGTNADLSATGGASFVLKQVSSGAAITVARLACADLSDSAAGCTNAGANPTASLGLTAVNGTATTYMRSDAAPALSVAITPTWTGTHTFNNGTYSALFTGGYVGINTTSPNSQLQIYGPQPTGTVSYPTGAIMYGHLNVDTSDAYTTQKGGRIVFSGELDTTHTHGTWGAIQGIKYNAVSGNSGGGLQFLTGNNNTGTMAVGMMIDSFGAVTMPLLANASGNDILCFASSTGLVTYASSVVGCVPSAMNLKNMIGTLDGVTALNGIASVDVGIYTYKASTGLDQREMIGLYADQICKIDERLCHRDAQGKIDNYDKVGALALAFASIKQLKADNDNLRAANDNLEARLKRLERHLR